MNSIFARRLAALIPVAVIAVASTASAAPILIGFDSDPAPVNVANGFTSADSGAVHFSDTSGADLIVLNSATVSNGSNALAVFYDDASALRIDLDFVAEAISFDFGNDDPLFSQASDQAVLTTFLGGTQVGQVMVAMNRNRAMDQTIAFAGVNFDSAIFQFAVGKGLAEVVDNLSITPAIPEPGAAVVFATGALLFGAALGRRSPARRRHRELRR